MHNRSLGVDTTSSTKVRASMEPTAAYDFIDDDTCDPASDMLALLGLQKKPIAKDGNCLFASICDQLEQHLTFQETCDTSTQHAATAVATMRQHIANHMIAYKERFLPFFATDASPIDALVQNCHYMRKMHDACQRNWGDHPELQAAANLYCVCIEVFASTLAGLAVSGHYPFQLPNETDNDYEHRCQELPVIRLHLADEHYSSTCDLVDPLCTPPHTSPIESEADLPSTDSESDAPGIIPTGAPTEVTPSTTPMSVPSAEMPARRAVRCMSRGESSSPLAKLRKRCPNWHNSCAQEQRFHWGAVMSKMRVPDGPKDTVHSSDAVRAVMTTRGWSPTLKIAMPRPSGHSTLCCVCTSLQTPISPSARSAAKGASCFNVVHAPPHGMQAASSSQA